MSAIGVPSGMTTAIRSVEAEAEAGGASALSALRGGDRRIPLATKLILSFLAVIGLISVPFMVVGIRLIDNRVVSEAQETVRNDLNAAREIQLSELERIGDAVRLTADRFLLRDALKSGDMSRAAGALLKVENSEELDLLSVTDAQGKVLFRTSNATAVGDSQAHDDLVGAVISHPRPVAAHTIVEASDLRRESAALALQARFEFIETPKARPREDTEETAGMMLKAAAPILDEDGTLLGILYGGVLQNRNFGTVDKIKQTVFQGLQYEGKDIGTATIFQDDVRISTNVRNVDGTRALGTRVTEEVYDRVVRDGQPWVDRAYVVNNWYITAYEPIRNIDGEIIGILYVGLLEDKYNDVRAQTIMQFVGITLIGTAAAMALGYHISRRMSKSVSQLATASMQVAEGNLEARVEIDSNDELEDLAHAFNSMASALQARDEELKEHAKSRVRRSERLAMVGQLAAGVAHELENPMQGIVTDSLRLLEKMPQDDERRGLIDSIVRQANRCTQIVRELLDFSRQKTAHRSQYDVGLMLEECISLVEKQELFRTVEIVKEVEPGLPPLCIDPKQIQQVLMNLIINAAEAMEGSGCLFLTARLRQDGRFVELEVTDSGPGISEENLGQVFAPFFTTKEAGVGVGLGLAISDKIVREHKGSMSVESEEGRGTTFRVLLPTSSSAEEGQDA